MFVDEAGWGRQAEPAPKRMMTLRQERLVLRLVLANALLLLIAPIGGGTIIEGLVMMIANFR